MDKEKNKEFLESIKNKSIPIKFSEQLHKVDTFNAGIGTVLKNRVRCKLNITCTRMDYNEVLDLCNVELMPEDIFILRNLWQCCADMADEIIEFCKENNIPIERNIDKSIRRLSTMV